MNNLVRLYHLAHAAMVVAGGFISSRIVFRTASPVHTRDNTAMIAFICLKVAFVIFSLYALLYAFDTGALIAQSYTNENTQSYTDENTGNGEELQKSAYYRVHDAIMDYSQISILIFQTCGLVIDALIAMILPRFITAILNAHFGDAGLAAKSVRITSFGLAMIQAALAIIIIGLGVAAIHYQGDADNFQATAFPLIGAYPAFRIVLFATSLAVVAGSVIVNIQTRDNAGLAWPSTMLVAASLVWISHAFMVPVLILFKEAMPAHFIFVVFEAWSQYAVLMIVYMVWFRENNGIWSGQNALTQAQKTK